MATINRTGSYESPRFLDRMHALWQRIVTFAGADRSVALANLHTTALPDQISDLLAQAIREDSNHALEWLWYARHVDSVTEQRYCIERARQINPEL